MKIAPSVVGTMAVVTVGEWAGGKPLDIKVVVGGGFLLFGLALLQAANPDFAGKFALFIFIVALFKYVPDIALKFGLRGGHLVKGT
jgi:hypothetical protein